MRIVPRSEIGLDPIVRSSNGQPRPPMSRPAAGITVHYTGIPQSQVEMFDAAQVLKTERHASHAGKPNEYNYMIGDDVDDLIYEVAGPFRAAHSAGENGSWIGVQFMLGVGTVPTDRMVAKFRWLRRHLTTVGALGRTHLVKPHRAMPGAATICPGDAVLSRWGDLLELDFPNPDPEPTEEAPMPDPPSAPFPVYLEWRPGTDDYTAMIWTGTHLAHVVDGNVGSLALAGTPPIRRQIVSDAELAGIIASTTPTTPPPPRLQGAMRDEWTYRRDPT